MTPCLNLSSINALSGRAAADVNHRSTRLLTHLLCTDPIPKQNVGQISPAIPLSWLHAPSSALSHPPLPLQNPNTPPSSSVYPVFSGSHSSHTHPLSGRDSKQRHSTNFCPLSSMPPPLQVSQTYSLAFLPPRIPITPAGHVFMCAFGCFITQGRSASPHTGSTPIAA